MPTVIEKYELPSDLDNTVRAVNSENLEDPLYLADNGILRAEFYQQPNRIVVESKGRRIVYEPREIKYVAGAMQDTIYAVGDAPLEAKGPNMRFNRSFPDIDDQFTVEGDKLKHSILVQGYQRDPRPWLSGPIDFVVSGRLEFDADLIVWGAGSPQTEPFETEQSVVLMDRNRSLIFELPPIVAFDSAFPERAQTDGKYRITQIEPGAVSFEVVVDQAWLASDERRYPVVIDPTVVATTLAHTNPMTGGGGHRGIHVMPDGTVLLFYVDSSRKTYYSVSMDDGQTFTKYSLPANTILTGTSGSATEPWLFATAYEPTTDVFWIWLNGRGVPTYMSAKWDPTTKTLQTSSWTKGPSNWPVTADSNNELSVAVNPQGQVCLAVVCNTTSATNARLYIMTFSGATKLGATLTVVAVSPAINTASSANYITGNCYTWWDSFNGYFWCASNTGGMYNLIRLKSLTVSSTSNLQNENIYTYYQSDGLAVCQVDANTILLTIPKMTTTYSIIQRTGGVGVGTYTTKGTITLKDSNNGHEHIALGLIGSTPHLFYVGSSGLVQQMLTSTGDLAPVSPVVLSSTTACAGTRCLQSHSTKLFYTWTESSSSFLAGQWVDNAPPLAPTLDQHVNFDATTAQTFSWTFHDTPSDAQSAYQLEIYDASNTSTPVVSVPKTGSATSMYSLPANTLVNGKSYQWRVLTYDQGGAVSPWSSYSTFRCSSAPQASIVPPATITSDTFTFSGQYIQAQGAPQQAFQFCLWDAVGTTLLKDSGTILGTSNLYTMSGLQNNTGYQIELIVTSQDGVSSSSGKQLCQVSYTPPPIPVVSVTNHAVSASVTVTWSNPAPSGEQPAIVTNQLYRRKAGSTDADWLLVASDLTEGSYVDYTCPAGTYEYGVRGVGDTGAISDYGVAQVESLFAGQWLIDELDPETSSVPFYYNNDGGSVLFEEDVTYIKTFSTYLRERRGQARSRTGKLDALYLASDGDVNAQIDLLDAMCTSERTYLLKLSSGRNVRVRPSKLEYKSEYGILASSVSITWTEVGPV